MELTEALDRISQIHEHLAKERRRPVGVALGVQRIQPRFHEGVRVFLGPGAGPDERQPEEHASGQRNGRQIGTATTQCRGFAVWRLPLKTRHQHDVIVGQKLVNLFRTDIRNTRSRVIAIR